MVRFVRTELEFYPVSLFGGVEGKVLVGKFCESGFLLEERFDVKHWNPKELIRFEAE